MRRAHGPNSIAPATQAKMAAKGNHVYAQKKGVDLLGGSARHGGGQVRQMNCWVAWVMKPANAASLIVTPTRATSALFKKKPAMRVTMSANEAVTVPTITSAAARLRKTAARLWRPDHLRPDRAPSSPMSQAWARARSFSLSRKPAAREQCSSEAPRPTQTPDKPAGVPDDRENPEHRTRHSADRIGNRPVHANESRSRS